MSENLIDLILENAYINNTGKTIVLEFKQILRTKKINRQ